MKCVTALFSPYFHQFLMMILSRPYQYWVRLLSKTSCDVPIVAAAASAALERGRLLVFVKNQEDFSTSHKGIRFHHLGMGFFWACSMLCHRSSLLLPPTSQSSYLVSTLVIFSLTVNIITMLSISAYLKNDPERITRVPTVPFVASASLGVVCYSLVAFVAAELVMPLILLGSLLTGLGFGFLWGSWTEVYGRMHPTRNAILMALVFIFTIVVFFIVSGAEEVLGIPVAFPMILLPPASYLCLRRCRAELGPTNYHHEDRAYLDALGSLWQLLLGAVVLSFLFGFVWQLTVIFVGSVNEAHRLPLLGNLLIGLAILGFAVLAKRRVNLNLIYRFIGPAIVGFCLLAPWFLRSTPVVLNAVMSTGFGAFDIVIWYMVSECSYDRRVSGFVIGSVVRSVSLMARLMGIIVASLFATLPSGSDILLFALFAGSAYLLVIWLLSYRRNLRRANHEQANKSTNDTSFEKGWQTRGAQATTTTATEAGGGDSMNNQESTQAMTEGDELERIIGERSALMARTFNLTCRESEVLPYLLQGRSARYIAGALFVSENTVRSHIRRILEKTTTHSKQSLIDIADALVLQQGNADSHATKRNRK
ncbi:MAG: helix-turn-helix transcriptional regulator [Coriobacteriales bacterium]|jgi:DNA-binding CsgD family transcriptional regulator|nr:helix-turn-helix transcriptional regulator [Coriobacteriales bacterium]